MSSRICPICQCVYDASKTRDGLCPKRSCKKALKKLRGENDL